MIFFKHYWVVSSLYSQARQQQIIIFSKKFWGVKSELVCVTWASLMLPLLRASCRIHGLEVSSKPQVAFLGLTQELFVTSEKALGLAVREGAEPPACQVICSYVPAPSVEDWVMHFLSSFSDGPRGNPWCSCAGCPAGMKRRKNIHIASWLR